MDSDLKSKKQVNLDQLKALIDFLTQNQDLAKGLSRGRRGKFNNLRLWNQCAKTINAVEDGAIKDGKGWSKYWCDWKYRVRRRALELKAAKDNNRALPDGFTTLSPLEERILNIIGEISLDTVIIKSDPLASKETDEDLDTVKNNDTSEQVDNATRPRCKKRRLSKNVTEYNNFGESSSLQESKTVLNSDHLDDTDNESSTFEFLRLEREKLENTKNIQNSLNTIATQVTRLADIMVQIKDALITNSLKK